MAQGSWTAKAEWSRSCGEVCRGIFAEGRGSLAFFGGLERASTLLEDNEDKDDQDGVNV